MQDAGLNAHDVVWAFAHTGQSLAEGGVGNDPVSGVVSNPNEILMLRAGPVGYAAERIGPELTTLTERARATIASSYMASVCRKISQTPRQLVFHGQARGGMNYEAIKKGGSTGVYESVIAQAKSVKAATPLLLYKALSVIHGEQDGIDNNAEYASNLIEWQADFETDLKAITGQTQDIPMFICQASSSSGYSQTGGIAREVFLSQLAQLQAHKNNAKINLVCPKYHLEYFDHSHITNSAQWLLGEYYAKAFAVVERGDVWEPLMPAEINGAGNTIAISFTGRSGNLVFDTVGVLMAENYGFSYQDAANNTISSVQIVGEQIVIALSGPIGRNPIVSYAFNNGRGGAVNQAAGYGSRGNLRDSDTAVAASDNTPLYNWCVIFREAVTCAP